MSDLFDVRKEIILITGASQGAGAAIRAPARRAAAVQMDVTDVASIGNAVAGVTLSTSLRAERSNP